MLFISLHHRNQPNSSTMPAVGPQLPPHLLEKRKREDDNDDNSGSENDRSSSPDSTSKRQRAIGPTLPPAPLDERPVSSPTDSPATALQAPEEDDLDHENDDSNSESDSEDDFGPALPTATSTSISKVTPEAALPSTAPPPPPPPPSQRDEWMLIPPTSSDWSARIDPTKLKARKFNTTNKPHSSPSAATTDSNNNEGKGHWNETPQEKQARLQREIMGIREPSSTNTTSSSKPSTHKHSANSGEDKETRARLKEYNASRGPSLYASHQKSQTKEEDDDPSARAFDREKDIGGGLQLNSTQRRDLMKKASDFGSRFGSAKYL